MTKRAIIIAGVVRTPDRFQEFLGELFPFAAEQQMEVIVSTWKGELDQYPEISTTLANSRCIVLEQDEPTLFVAGHVLHQIQALDAGLSLLDDGVFVQRLRPDFANMADVRAFCLQEPAETIENSPVRHLFRHRLYINACILAHPFYINDMSFAGMAGDLRRMTKTPVVYWTQYTRMAAEQLIWGTPSISLNPTFDYYFRSNVGLIFDDQENAFRSIECLKRSHIYHKSLASYVYLLGNLYTNLHGKPDMEQTIRQCEPFTLEEILWSNVDQPWARFHSSTHTMHVHDSNVAKALILGRFSGSEFGDGFRAELEKIDRDDPGFFFTATEIDQLITESRQLADDLEEGTNVKGFKVIRQTGAARSITGMQPQWRIVNQRTEREFELEQEVNRLRRLVDASR